MTTTGKIVGVNGNMITVAFDGAVAQNEVGYAVLGDKRLMAEIVRVRGRRSRWTTRWSSPATCLPPNLAPAC